MWQVEGAYSVVVLVRQPAGQSGSDELEVEGQCGLRFRPHACE